MYHNLSLSLDLVYIHNTITKAKAYMVRFFIQISKIQLHFFPVEEPKKEVRKDLIEY